MLDRKIQADTQGGPDMKDTPIYICSKDRATCLRQLVDKLREQGYENLIVVDNGSTWPPMLELLEQLELPVVFWTPKGRPKWSLWETGLLLAKRHFVWTDVDIIPDCAPDWMEKLYSVLDRHPDFPKAGLSIRTNDIPDTYRDKQEVIAWEKHLYEERLKDEICCWRSHIDTTLALYRPETKPGLRGIRLGKPYLSRHLTWYYDSSNPSEEYLYYLKNLHPQAGMWSRKDHNNHKMKWSRTQENQ
jgi:hypothetical protein